MTRLYLVRHGETLWNNQIRIQGHRDVPLSDLGRQQARMLAARIARLSIDRAYTSDLARAAETAAIVLADHAIPLLREPGLREADFGEWEGLTYEEIRRRYPDEHAAWRERPAEAAPPGGESLGVMLVRVRRAMEMITSAHPGGDVLVVTHGGTLRVLLGAALGLGLDSYWKVRVDNCSLSIIDTYPEGAIVSAMNDTCHLDGLAHGGLVP